MDNSIVNLRDTIVPKSDQLNADDLIGMEKVITVTSVRRGNAESPIFIDYDGSDGRPYKPCKTMRRLIMFAWGENGNNWIGKSMRLYNEPTVKYAGKEVGGIRINAFSHIDKPIDISLTATRGSKQKYQVSVLQPQQKPDYPADKFVEAMPAMADMVKAGKMTVEQVITKCEQTGRLSEEQRAQIRKLADTPEMAEDEFFNEE